MMAGRMCSSNANLRCKSTIIQKAVDPSFAALLWGASFERCSTNKYTENCIIYFTDLQLQQERYDEARIIFEEFCGNGANE